MLAAATPQGANAAGELVIEASGEGPELSDIPIEPFIYAPVPRHEGPSPVEGLLETLVSPRTLLGLPEETLELEFGGALPYVRDPRLLTDDE